jgi:AcrR family transcriptional regulator
VLKLYRRAGALYTHLPVYILTDDVMPPRTGAETKQRILDSAFSVFWRQGFVRASVDEVAKKADVTKRTRYQHYRSKDDLMASVVAHSTELAMERLRRISGSFPTEADGMIDSLFAQLAKWAAQPRWPGPGLTRVVAELADLPGHPARVIARSHKATVETWLADLLRKANVREAAARAREIMVLIEGAMSLVLIHGDPVYFDIAAQAAKRLVADNGSARP